MPDEIQQNLIAIGEQMRAYRIVVATEGSTIWIAIDTRRDLFEFGLFLNEKALQKMAKQIRDINTLPNRCGLTELLNTQP